MVILAQLFGTVSSIAQTSSYSSDFQNNAIQTALPGWTDFDANGQPTETIFRTWPDPLRDGNTVYGLRATRRRAVQPQPSAAPDRYGAFSIYTAQSFDDEAFTFTGRFLAAHSQFAVVFFYSPGRYYSLGATDGTIQLSATAGGNLAGIVDSRLVPQPDLWYRFRIEADGTSIRARVWPDSTAEPQTFSIIAVDNSSGRLTTGNIGLWAGGGDFYVDDLAVVSGQSSTSSVTFVDAVTNQTLDPSSVAMFDGAAHIRIVATGDVPVTLDGAPYVSGSAIAGDGTHSLVAHAQSGDVTLQILIDTIAPELSVATPAVGSCTNAQTLSINGRAIDLTLASVKVGTTSASVDAMVANDGTFTATIPAPADGPADLLVEAHDRLSHVSVIHVPIVIDRVKPAIEITQAGALFDGGAFNRPLAFMIRPLDSDPSASVTSLINGQPYVSGALIDQDGAYTLTATARDCAGNVSDQKSIQFAVDRVAPRLVSIDPADGSTVGSGPLTIRGTTDADDLQTAAIDASASSLSGRNFTFDALKLAEGANHLNLVLTDRAGNSARVAYTLTLKTTKPEILIVEDGSPIAQNALFNRAVTPIVRANEASAMLTATVNGAAFTSGTTITNDGTYTLNATASDNVGHTATAAVTFSIDRTPPVIKIESPADGATISADHVDVRVSASGADSITINGSPATGTVTIPLETGANLIVAIARDGAGNSAADQIVVTRDDGRPGIILTAPADNVLTNRPVIAVAGQVLSPDPGIHVAINGTEVPVDASGAFSVVNFPLVEGVNSITATIVAVSAKLAHASASGTAVTSHVTADLTPPQLTVMANGIPLQNGDRFGAAPSITFQASDDRPGVTTTVTLDGVAGDVTNIKEGGHTLSAVARDAAGNETRVDRSFIVGSGGSAGCVLSNFDPADGSAIFASSVKMSGSAAGASAITINGVAAALSDGSFAAHVQLPVEGANPISITCGAATKTLMFFRVTGAPSITIDTPARNAIIGSDTITVTGHVGSDVVSGDVNGVPFTPANGAFSVPNISLANGANIITARARNGAGRGGVTTTYVIRPGTPRLTMTSPLPSTQTGASSIGVSGVYTNVDPSTIAISGASVETRSISDTTGTFIARSVPVSPAITVTGRNAAGVSTSASVDLQNVAGAPSISIDSPADDSAFAASQDSVAVAGAISTSPGAVVQVNGSQVAVDGTNHFAASVSLSNGVTPVIARVSTPDGQSASDSIRLFRFSGPFNVRDSFPAVNANEVDPGVLVVALFTNPVDGSSARTAVTLTDASGQSVGTTLYVDNDAMSIAPNIPLSGGSKYTVTISTGLKDAAGSPLAQPFTLTFTTSGAAPAVPPVVDQSDTSGCFQTATITGKAAVTGARVRLDLDGVSRSVASGGDGAFKFDLTFSGAAGYHIARIREVGGDGTLSPEATVCYRISCTEPQVLAASLDRTAKRLTIQFSKPVNASSIVASPSGTIILGSFTGTVSLNGAGDTATIAYDSDLGTAPLMLTVSKNITDASGLPMAADYTQVFSIDDSTRASGKGYVTGAVYDASTGRPLAGAIVAGGSTDERGRYVRTFDEGAQSIDASAPGFTTAWREVVVRAGAGTVPLDFRLTKRAADQIANGASMSMSDGGDTAITRRAELTIASAALVSGTHLSLTSLGSQSLPAPLPLGWSPIAAAEIAVNGSASPAPIAGSTLTFVLTAADATALAAATQTASIVQYDSARDEWHVVVAVASITSDERTSANILTSGDFALVYPDRGASLQQPPPARTGAALQGVSDPCTATPDVCRPVSRSFVLDPASVAPNGRTVAALITDGAKPYPSGTAVQATIDEQLNLADGSVIVDPPFTADLLLYRTPAGDAASAVFALAPTARAASVTLRDGVDHVRIDDRPDRIDRGALIGAEGGRVSGEMVSIDIPKGATTDPVHGAITTISDFSAFGAIAGFHIAGGFTFTLTRGDGGTTPVALLEPANATLTIPSTTQQVILCEVLNDTPFGTIVRLAALTDRSTDTVFTTKTIDRAALPLDGIVRAGTYLILKADSPIAFAFGQVRVSSGGTTLASALVVPELGVTDISRIGGVFVVPVPARPAAPFSLRARSTATGDGAPATYASSPDSGAIVPFGDLILAVQPPHFVSVTPNDGAVLDPGTAFLVQATFDAPIDASSVAGSMIVNNLTINAAVAGSVDSAGPIVTFHPSEPLQPATEYSVSVLPQLRGANGAPFGRSVVARFSTRNLAAANSSIRPDLIHITIPDKQGVSTISGRAGALPAGAQAIAIRRSIAFVTQYQSTAGVDGSFSFIAGDGADAIAVTDAIDLQVIDPVSHAAIAVIPLTPFTTNDGKGFLAPTEADVHFVTPDGVTVNVPAGAFDSPTLITTSPVTEAAFANVPSLSSTLTVSSGVNLQFDGTANKRIDIDLPIPPNTDPSKPLYLGYLGQSALGPRVMVVDTLRVDNGHLTTKLPGNVSSASIHPASTSDLRPNSILTSPGDVKNALLGAVNGGTYAATSFVQQVSWAVIDGLASVDVFFDSMPSMFASALYLFEGRGRVLVPLASNVKFTVSGVDPATGLESFRKLYDPLANPSNPVDAVALPSPIENTIGPYPVFTSPARVEQLDLTADNLMLTSVRNIEVTMDSGSVTVRPSSAPLSANTRVEALNLDSGDLQSVADFSGGASMRMRASVGDRLLLIIAEKDVDASEAVSVVFNKPIFINGDADAYIQSERLIKVLSRDLNASTTTDFADITKQVKFDADSGNRRVNIHFESPLQLGKLYRLVVSRNIGDTAGLGGSTDLRLGQRRINGTVGSQLSDDLHIEFATREPGGKIASFNLQQGAVRDLALTGNIALVSALGGGIQAYDLSDPASLDASNNPRPFATVPAAATEFWAVAADRHGRVYTTGLTSTFGVLRTYRLADFISSTGGIVNRQVAAATLSWRPGINANVPVGTEVSLSDRPEATPRKMQVVLQDTGDDTPFTPDTLVQTFSGTSSDAGSGFQLITINVRADRASQYQVQTITVENRTLDLRWSVDVARNGTAAIRGILARPQDKLYVIRNQRTYAVVSLFGYGVSIFDLNAVESNDYQPAEENYKPLQEQLAKSSGADESAPAAPCDPQQSADSGTVCPIRDLSLSPEALIQGGNSLKVFALDASRGVLDLTLVQPSSLTPAGGGLTFATSLIDQPRLRTLRDLYRTASSRQPFAHFTSIAAYKNYALIAANQFGLLVVDLSAGALSWDSLADVVWIPAGAYSVRVMPDSDLGVIVDGAGRVLLVDLTKIDESSKVAALPVCRNASCSAELFPTAKKALESRAAPPSDADWLEVGADDPRIIWKSAAHLVRGTLAPLVDPTTGFLFSGDVGTATMDVIAAVDPKLSIVINNGRDLGTATGVVPLGIAPPDNNIFGVDGSLGAFRIETTLPGGIVDPKFAVENESMPEALAPATPPSFPPAHLRGSRALTLVRGIPADILRQTPSLRFQRGGNRYVSPWIVALADARAAKQYTWPAGADKAAAGCFACDRPQFLRNDSNAAEIFANGRSMVVHPDAGTFTGPYDYLNKSHRLTVRLASYAADTVRPTNVLTAGQDPPVAVGALQSTALLHSGELVEQSTDLDAGGRAGWDVIFDRTYRSRTIGGTALGLGWESSMFRRLRALPSGDVEYRDGTGEEWVFRKRGDAYVSPTGLYLLLSKPSDRSAGWILTDQKQRITKFDALGRLTSESDVFYDQNGGGNIIHYFYDSAGRLTSVVDPVGRMSTLAYADDGSLKTITDWRKRAVDYHVDSDGLLKSVDLPRTKNTEYLEFDHSTDSTRPTVRYDYTQPSSGDYNGKVELFNLHSVQEPGDSTPRVTFDYFDSGAQRDMLQQENWGTFDNAKAKFEYSINSQLESSYETVVTDALGQRRTYRISALFPTDYFSDRVHVDQMIESAVPIWSAAAFGALPDAVLPSMSETSDVDRRFSFDREDDGRINKITKVTTAGSVSETTYGYQPAGTTGFVRSSTSIVGSQQGMNGLTQNYEHDGAFLKSVTSDGDRVDTPEPRRGSLTPRQSDGGVTAETVYKSDGLVSQWHTLEPAAPAAGTGEKATNEYYDPDDTTLHQRAMPKKIVSGDDLVTTITYPDADTEVRDAPRGVETRAEYDELRRPIHVRITGPGAIAPEEWFAYDSRGRVVRHRKSQGDKQPEERFEYDLVGRLTRSSLYDGATEVEKTQYSYALPDRILTTELPAGGLIFTNLDGLGRTLERKTNPLHPFATIKLERTRYDADDNVVFTTDGREATSTRFDAAHRALETLRSDQGRIDTIIDGWGRLRDSKDVGTGARYQASYTPAGKLQSVNTNTSSQQYSWDAAGRTRSIVSRNGPNEPVAQSTFQFDEAGRMLEQKSGQSDGTDIQQAFSHTQYMNYNGTEVPAAVTTSEDNDRNASVWNIEHDALGRSTRVQNATTSSFTYEQPADESGNVTSRKTPARRGTFEYSHDARGLTTEERLPAAGSPNRYEYDPGGAIKRYVDPQSEETAVTNDGLGRPVLRTYPDGSTEEIHYDGDQVSAIRDRQGRWLRFDYNLRGQLEQIRNDSTVLDTLTYDSAGRLIGWKSEDTKIEYDDFDADDRPQTTRQIRYRSDGTEVDRYTQRHTWNGAGQRTSWTMPSAVGMDTRWTSTVFEDHDAMGNVIAIRRSAAGASVPLMTAEFRNAGRPKSRTVILGAGPAQLVRRYNYDDVQTGVGRLTEVQVFSGSSLVAGSRVAFTGLLRESEQLLGVAGGDRVTRWTYDDRGRLATMIAATGSASAAGVGVPAAVMPILTDADFESDLVRGQGTLPSSRFTPKPGHKVGTIERGDQSESILYQKADGSDGGSHRTQDGKYRYQFDERGRLRIVTERFGNKRVMYSYNAMDRMVGRRVEKDFGSGDWRLSDATAPLPAAVTFVWDPFSDQLIAMFEAETGRPLRQFIHGGIGYDDPIEVFDGSKHYYPILDEAGTDHLQAVVDETGTLVNRTIVADPYGEDAETLNGPAVDKITISGTVSETKVMMHVSEPLDPSTLAGARLTPSAPTPILSDPQTVAWTLTSLPQQGNLSIEITSLRSTTFGANVPVLFSGFTIAVSAVPRDGTITPFNLTSLAQIGTRGATDLSATLVMSPFKAHPFTDPMTGLDYVRARWLDKRTGTFLSPDPAGYRDSANLYAYCAGDPVNCSDPTGRSGEMDPIEEEARKCEETRESSRCAGPLGRIAAVLFGDENSAEPPEVLEPIGAGAPMIYVNGIQNGVAEARAYAGELAAWMHVRVTPIHNPSINKVYDLVQTAVANKISAADATTRLIVREIRRQLQQLRSGEYLKIAGHSQGAVIVSAALSYIPVEERHRIDVISIGGAACTFPVGLHSVTAFVNVRDAVPMSVGLGLNACTAVLFAQEAAGTRVELKYLSFGNGSFTSSHSLPEYRRAAQASKTSARANDSSPEQIRRGIAATMPTAAEYAGNPLLQQLLPRQ